MRVLPCVLLFTARLGAVAISDLVAAGLAEPEDRSLSALVKAEADLRTVQTMAHPRAVTGARKDRFGGMSFLGPPQGGARRGQSPADLKRVAALELMEDEIRTIQGELAENMAVVETAASWHGVDFASDRKFEDVKQEVSKVGNQMMPTFLNATSPEGAFVQGDAKDEADMEDHLTAEVEAMSEMGKARLDVMETGALSILSDSAYELHSSTSEMKREALNQMGGDMQALPSFAQKEARKSDTKDTKSDWQIIAHELESIAGYDVIMKNPPQSKRRGPR